jgi:hypothetical protein
MIWVNFKVACVLHATNAPPYPQATCSYQYATHSSWDQVPGSFGSQPNISKAFCFSLSWLFVSLELHSTSYNNTNFLKYLKALEAPFIVLMTCEYSLVTKQFLGTTCHLLYSLVDHSSVSE